MIAISKFAVRAVLSVLPKARAPNDQHVEGRPSRGGGSPMEASRRDRRLAVRPAARVSRGAGTLKWKLMIAGRCLGSLTLLVTLALGASACRRAEKPREVQRQEQPAGNSAAREVGRGAYKATQGAEKVLKKAGKELGKGIKEAAAGWKEASRESKAKKARD